jgi:hypothetical protein
MCVYMTREDQVLIVNVMVTDSMWETVILNVIIWLAGADTKLNIIIKICKYTGFHEEHHFILIVIEMYDAFEHH